MQSNKKNILVVDDDKVSLKLVGTKLSQAGYGVIEESSSRCVIDVLKNSKKNIDVILLDKIMPEIDGIEVLKFVKSQDNLRNIPVIMQTVDTDDSHILECISAGAFHYLAKPFNEEITLAIIDKAIEESNNKNRLIKEMKDYNFSLGLMTHGCFEFRTPVEARDLSFLISKSFPDPESVLIGINELMINAIEHGNLGIGYAQKTKLINNLTLQEEINKRLKSKKYQARHARVEFTRNKDNISLYIKDMGDGFDWKHYMEMSAKRAVDPHGRGIAMARMLSFDDIQYMGKGNEVLCTVKL